MLVRLRHRHSVVVGISCCRVGPRSRLGSSDPKMIVMQSGVKEQEERTLSLMPPHRVGCEHHNVAFADRYIENGRLAGKLASPRQHSADKKRLLIRRESQ